MDRTGKAGRRSLGTGRRCGRAGAATRWSIRHSALNDARHNVTRLVFAADLPPMGYRVYHFATWPAATASPTLAHARRMGWRTSLSPGFDPQTGDIVVLRGQGQWRRAGRAGRLERRPRCSKTRVTPGRTARALRQAPGQFGEARMRSRREWATAGLALRRAYLGGQCLAAANRPARRVRRYPDAQLAALAGPAARGQARLRCWQQAMPGRT